MAEGHIYHVAEALDVSKTPAIESLYLFRVHATPSRLGPARVVLENQILGTPGHVPWQGHIAEVAYEQATAWSKDTFHLQYRSVCVEPPPALASAHDVEAGCVASGSLGATWEELGRQSSLDGGSTCNVKHLRGDVDADDLESQRGEAQSERSCSGSEIESALTSGDPPEADEAIEEAFWEAGAMTFVVHRGAAEVDHSACVVCASGFGAHENNLAVSCRVSRRLVAPRQRNRDAPIVGVRRVTRTDRVDQLSSITPLAVRIVATIRA